MTVADLRHLNLFFSPDTRVQALPNWQNPRLYLPAHGPIQSWKQSSFYPATRSLAQLYRLSLRLRAAVGIAETRTARSTDWPLRRFTQEVLPQLASAVVLIGTPGPAQAITVQLRDERDRVLGYLKYAEKDAALRRLRHEYHILSNLPAGIGPEPLKFGPFGKGEGLLNSAILGKPLNAALPPPNALVGLLDSYVVLPPVPLKYHPWVCRMQELGAPELDAWFELLAGRSWPVTVQHGDFAPWNLLRGYDGTLRAFDWEYGTLEGFPYLDLAYYALQTSALIYRQAPLEAASRVPEFLSRLPDLALTKAEAQALTRLAAYDAYQRSSEDGQPPDNGLQVWRRAVWRGTARAI
jgi:hypothetical protein